MLHFLTRLWWVRWMCVGCTGRGKLWCWVDGVLHFHTQKLLKRLMRILVMDPLRATLHWYRPGLCWCMWQLLAHHGSFLCLLFYVGSFN